MLLPNAENAVVELSKLRDYSLNSQHERGGHKARVFRAALGITVVDADWLREQILVAAREVEAAEAAPSVFGRRFVIDFALKRGTQAAIVRAAWIIEYGTDFPRLTSCYVL